MNRNPYFDYIEEKLNVLATRINTRGKLNMLSLHMHSENFYLHLFNLLFNYELKNLNTTLQNVEAIDLKDDIQKIIVQVSSTNTKSKIESALKKDIIKNHKGYTFKFISIAKDGSKLRKNTFKNPYSIKFNPKVDIHDMTSILNNILACKIEKMKSIYEFINKELGNEIDIYGLKMESNLATVINIVAEEKLDHVNLEEEINSFEVERKITHNKLISARDVIEEYKIHYFRVDKIYKEFDKNGKNKSNSVLASIRRDYLRLKTKTNPDDIFEQLTEKTIGKVIKSVNYVQIPIDELELCIDILVVDAFIRCKIFENPDKYSYGSS